MNTYRIDLINRLRATSSRKYSNVLNILLHTLEDDRTSDIEVNRVMIDIIISQDKQLRDINNREIDKRINKTTPDDIVVQT